MTRVVARLAMRVWNCSALASQRPAFSYVNDAGWRAKVPKFPLSISLPAAPLQATAGQRPQQQDDLSQRFPLACRLMLSRYRRVVNPFAAVICKRFDRQVNSYEAPHYTKQAEGRAEQHHCRATIGNHAAAGRSEEGDVRDALYRIVECYCS
jgi:hypothetical protein